jgi:hypothetical protein
MHPAVQESADGFPLESAQFAFALTQGFLDLASVADIDERMTTPSILLSTVRHARKRMSYHLPARLFTRGGTRRMRLQLDSASHRQD